MKAEIKVSRHADGRFNWPTICACPLCHGVTKGLSGPNNFEKAEALTFALLQYGYYMAAWEKSNVAIHVPFPCECKCEHKWTSRGIGRCLHETRCEKCGVKFQVDSSD